jgi:hypothetical protein
MEDGTTTDRDVGGDPPCWMHLVDENEESGAQPQGSTADHADDGETPAPAAPAADE